MNDLYQFDFMWQYVDTNNIIIIGFGFRMIYIARIMKAEVCVICQKAEADNTNQGLDHFSIMRNPNPIIIIVLLYILKTKSSFQA